MACILATAVSVTSCANAEQTEYRVLAPDASSFDIQARRALLATTSSPVLKAARVPYLSGSDPREVCARHSGIQPVTKRFAIPPFYGDRQAWRTAIKPFHALENAATELAAYFVVSGDKAHASSLIKLLERWAVADALIGFATGPNGHRQS